MEIENKDERLVRTSICKTCNNLVTVMALEIISHKDMRRFEKEVEKHDLMVETKTLKAFREQDTNFCTCKS